MLRNVELFHRFGERDEHRMFRDALIAGVEVGLPLVEQFQRDSRVAHFIAEVVGNAAVSVDVEEVLAQAAGKKPAGDGEIFVMSAGQAGAVGAGFVERGGSRGNGVGGGKAAPAECGGGRYVRVGCGYGRHSMKRVHSSAPRATLFPCGHFTVYVFKHQHWPEPFFSSLREPTPCRKVESVLVGSKQAVPQRDVREIVSMNIELVMYRV